MDQWETSYTANALDFDSGGSNTGVTDLQELGTDVAVDNSPLSYAEVRGFGSNPVLTVPDAAGAEAVIYNLAGTWHAPLNLTADVLAQVFSGTITTWNNAQIQALNPVDDLPSTSIVVVHRSDADGSSYTFQQFMAYDGEGAWAYNYSTAWLGPSTIPGELAARGSSGVAADVKTDVGAISYVGLEFALSNAIPTAAIQNPSGNFVVPTVTDTQSAILDKVSETAFALPSGSGNWSSVEVLNPPGAFDYPIAYLSYAMVYENGSQAYGAASTTMNEAIEQSTWAFLNWSISSSGGQSYAAGLYYVPLPPALVANAEASLDLLTWSGPPIATCGLNELEAVSIAPTLSTLDYGQVVGFEAQAQCTHGACSAVTIGYTQSPVLGTLSTLGTTANFTAGDVAGTTTVTVRATLGASVREANATVTIVAPNTPILDSMVFDPAVPPTVDVGGTLDVYSAPVCTLDSSEASCPGGTHFIWTVVNGLGSLNTSSGTAVAFTAGSQVGTAVISVAASLEGVEVSSNYSVDITNVTAVQHASGVGHGPLDLGIAAAVVLVAVVAVLGVVLWRRRRPRPPPGSEGRPDLAPPTRANWADPGDVPSSP